MATLTDLREYSGSLALFHVCQISSLKVQIVSFSSPTPLSLSLSSLPPSLFSLFYFDSCLLFKQTTGFPGSWDPDGLGINLSNLTRIGSFILGSRGVYASRSYRLGIKIILFIVQRGRKTKKSWHWCPFAHLHLYWNSLHDNIDLSKDYAGWCLCGFSV